MGAKTHVKLRGHKCDACHRRFRTAPALKSHYKLSHILPNKNGLKRSTKPQEKITQQFRKLGQPEIPKNVEKETKCDLPPKKLRRMEFECPVCAKRFPVYFSAQKHIQKYHCVDDTGGQVLPNSPRLIKPIRIELCISCKVRTYPTEAHHCDNASTDTVTEGRYRCLGCQESFETMMVFEQHVKDKHDFDMLKLNFPNQEECSAWKKEFEAISGSNFLILHRGKYKKTFRCSHQKLKDNNKVDLCPSLAIVAEVGNQVQLSYYKDHQGHITNKLPTEMYEKYLEPAKTCVGTESESYIHFRRIMSRIVNEAPNVNQETLDILMAKAVEMTGILKKFDQEKESGVTNKSMNDSQISDVLEEKDRVRGKRRNSTDNIDTKRPKTDDDDETLGTTISDPKNLLEPMVKRKPISQKTVLQNKGTNKTDVKDPISPISRPFQSPPSFNDSYKNFVDQNFLKTADTPKVGTPASPPRKAVKKKEIVRTKLGQFKPNLSPKSKSPKENFVPHDTDGSKDFSTPKSGKFKPKPDTPAPWKKDSKNKVIKYEVKEQENDCNILILKI